MTSQSACSSRNYLEPQSSSKDRIQTIELSHSGLILQTKFYLASLSVCLSVCLFVCLSVCFGHSAYLPVYLYVHLYVCSSVCLLFWFYVYPFVNTEVLISLMYVFALHSTLQRNIPLQFKFIKYYKQHL